MPEISNSWKFQTDQIRMPDKISKWVSSADGFQIQRLIQMGFKSRWVSNTEINMKQEYKTGETDESEIRHRNRNTKQMKELEVKKPKFSPEMNQIKNAISQNRKPRFSGGRRWLTRRRVCLSVGVAWRAGGAWRFVRWSESVGFGRKCGLSSMVGW